MAVAHGWNWSRLTDWAKEDRWSNGRLGRITSVTGYMSSCLTDLFSGTLRLRRARRRRLLRWRPRRRPGRGPTREAATCTASSSHLLGLGLWLVPNEPEDVFARAHLLENGVDLDVQVSVALADGVIGSFSGQGHEPWARPHACDLRIAGDDGVLMLDFDRVQAQLLLEGDKERAEWLTLEPRAAACRERCRVHLRRPAQFLVDACLGRETINRAPLDLGVRTVAVMEAAWQSAHTRQPVRVADLVSV